MNRIIEPGYPKLDHGQNEISFEEATRIRIRVEFKAKLKSLTVKHDPHQEYCPDCSDIVGPNNKKQKSKQQDQQPSRSSLGRTSTTATLVPQPPHHQLHRRQTKKSQPERSYGLSSESSEYFKAHPDLKSPGPNPKRIPHDEVGNLLACFTDLHVAHEISINRFYRLQNVDDAAGNQIKMEMKQVFWDLFEGEVTAKTSSYHQTFSLITEIKAALHSLMMPHNHDLREQVNKVLDMNRMRQEVSKTSFDYDCYSTYIIDVLSQLCCPSRDAKIEEIRRIKEPAKIFQAIFAIMDKMKLDMQNFFINIFRPYIVKTSIENERKKFADYLNLEYCLHEDGLRATRSWLNRHRLGLRRDTLTVIAKAYGEILWWTKDNEPWPETLMEDVDRFRQLRMELDRIGIVGGVLLELGKIGQKIFKNPPPTLRKMFRKYIKLLIPPGQTEDEERLKNCLEAAAQHAVEATETIITKYLKRPMTDIEKTQIQDAVIKVSDKRNSFRCLILRRTVDYAEEIIMAADDHFTVIPSSLTSVMYDVSMLVSQFHRIVQHNRACFEELYRDICEDRNQVPRFPEENDGNWDRNLLDTLRKLRSNIATPKEAEELAQQALNAGMKITADRVYQTNNRFGAFGVGTDFGKKMGTTEADTLTRQSSNNDADTDNVSTGATANLTIRSPDINLPARSDDDVDNGVLFQHAQETFKEFCREGCKIKCSKNN